MYFATGVEPTKETALTLGWASSASTQSRPPWTRLSTPLGSPAFSRSSARITAVSGTFSLGLRTNVLPQAMRQREHPEGDHRGEVERALSRRRPRAAGGSVSQSTSRARFSSVSPKRRDGDSARVLDVLDPAVDASAGLDEGLAVLARDAGAEPVEVLLDEVAVAEEEPGALDRRACPSMPGMRRRRHRLRRRPRPRRPAGTRRSRRRLRGCRPACRRAWGGSIRLR